MAQFRNTQDILDEILQKAGEPTNGNSPYETLALTYANKVHHAIIAGGNIFNVDVDEPWVWARSRYPLIMELQPAFTSGSINCTNGSATITFSTASATSLEGWHLQVTGKPTVYKITQHTANTVNAHIDSGFIDSSSTSYGFRAFKLDYEVTPAYFHIDNFNDRLDFQETAATTLSATLTHGTYTADTLLTHVVTQLGATGTASYGGAYDSVLKTFNVTASVSFKLFGASGPNVKRSILPTLGFDQLNHTGAQSYTSTYTPNRVSRLIEPLKIFSRSDGEPFIYSTDPIRMQEDFPMSQVVERAPSRFCRLTEDSSGSIWIRFNAYPKDTTKVMFDWIPQPLDLQDNAVSTPALPRGDVDTLIHGAAAYIAFDNEDSKWEGFLNLCRAGLDAMRKKNRNLLLRTGEFFGQQIPREDLKNEARKLDYGYE